MRIKLGSIITDAKGKLGGHIAARGVSSHVLYTNVPRGSSPSLRQTKNRAVIYSLQKYWGDLTESERNAWRMAAKPNEYGINTFVRRNFWFKYLQKPLVKQPIFVEQPTNIKNPVFTYSPQFPLVKFEGVVDGGIVLVVIYISSGLSRGIKNTPKDMRVIKTIWAPPTTLSLGLADDFRRVWGNIIPGTAAFLRVETYSRSGQLAERLLFREE